MPLPIGCFYFLIDLTAIIALVRLIIAVVMSIRIFNVSIISYLLSFSMSILYTYIIYMSRPILKNSYKIGRIAPPVAVIS